MDLKLAVLDTIPDPVWLKDTEGRFLAVNSAWCRHFGLNAEEVLGKTGFEFLPAEVAQKFAKEDGEVIRSQRCRQEEELLIDADGRPVWFETIKTPLIENGVVVGISGVARGITARKNAEEAVRASEKMYRELFDNNLDGVLFTSPDGTIYDANQAACAMLGMSREEIRHAGRAGVIDRTDPRLPALLERRQRAGKVKCELTFVRKDGSKFPGEVSSVILEDGERPPRAFVIFKDFTERKTREQEIERLNRLYAALSALHQIVVRATSRDELLRAVCRIATEKAGFRLAWVGQTDPQTQRIMPIVRAGDLEEYLDAVEVYADERPEGLGPTGKCMRENKVCVANNFAVEPCVAPWYAVATSWGLRASASLPIRNQGAVWGALTIYAGEPYVFQDKEITLLEEAAAAISFGLDLLDREEQRKKAEEDLRESERRLSIVFRTAPASICVSRLDDGRLIDVNDGFESMSGHSREESLGRTVGELRTWVDSEDREKFVAILREQGKVRNFETRFYHKSGRVLDMLIAAEPIELAGQPCLLSMTQDITDRKRAEQVKLEMERRLLHAQKLESLGILAGGVAHDFNNILAGIMGYAELVKAALPPSEPAQADIEVIMKSVQRAADLTRQMLAYAGQGAFHSEPVNVSRIIEEARKLLEVSVSKKAALQYRLAADLPSVPADPSQIHQVILNLVINASEALAEQNGEIVISTEEIHLSDADCAAIPGGSGLRMGPYVLLQVADTGCGMDNETLARIFDPFFTTKFTGRGLGLAAVHGIVRGHQGAIQVVSAPGQGTTFQVLLPACGLPATAARTAAVEPAWHGTGTVLVVDDEEIVCNLARRTIENVGFSVLTAKDGEEAIRLFQQHRQEIECVVLDLTMPKMDGAETLRELRRISPAVRVILSSGYSEDRAQDRFSGWRLAGFIQKPYRRETMIAALRKAVSDK
jgi:two-component system, cell cycle sensor histidine kinase and response regulator CckA